MMSDQINQLILWTEGADFAEAYQAADYGARSQFDNAVRRLDSRVDQLSTKLSRA